MACRPFLPFLAIALALAVAQGCTGSEDDDDGCPDCQPVGGGTSPFPPSVPTGQGREPPSGGGTSGGSSSVGGGTGGTFGGTFGGGTGGVGATGGVFSTGGTFTGGVGGF